MYYGTKYVMQAPNEYESNWTCLHQIVFELLGIKRGWKWFEYTELLAVLLA